MMVTAFVGIGSNLDSPLKQAESACQQLDQHPNIDLVQCSPWYGSKAVGPGEQPDYVNGVAELTTDLDAFALLNALQVIENNHGRVRTQVWGARTLDLDLLWYDAQVIDTADLKVPHPRIYERNFVLLPFKDIAPHVLLTKQDQVAELAEKLNSDGLWRI